MSTIGSPSLGARSETYLLPEPDIMVLEPKGKIDQIIQQVLDAKQGKLDEAKANKWERYHPVLIGGDIFTTGYLAFQAVQSFVPALAGIPAIGFATLICGEIAGVINIGVGLVSLKQGIQALRNGEGQRLEAVRLLIDFACCMAIGSILILSSLAIKVGALGGVGAFFAANPWLLPLCFFLATLPLIIELGIRIYRIFTHSDLGSKLQLSELKELIKDPNVVNGSKPLNQLLINGDNPLHIPWNMKKEFQNETEEETAKECFSAKMEELQGALGVEAGIEVFTLLKLFRDLEQENDVEKRKKLLDQIEEQIDVTQKKIEEWNRALYLRMFQQMIYVLGFAVSMVALIPGVAKDLLNGIQSAFLAVANAIPFGMDTFWPFKRNQPIIIPKVEQNEINVGRSEIQLAG